MLTLDLSSNTQEMSVQIIVTVNFFALEVIPTQVVFPDVFSMSGQISTYMSRRAVDGAFILFCLEMKLRNSATLEY